MSEAGARAARVLKAAYFLLGVGLLAAVVAEIDLAEVAREVSGIGLGAGAVLGVYFVAFVLDSVSWQLTIRGVPLTAAWAARVWAVRMVGEAFNQVVPAGGFGGEPVKAVMLKRRYGTGYGDGAASLILAKTINLMALVVFLIGGFALMIGHPALPSSYKGVATVGLAALGMGVLLFFAVQRYAVTSLAGGWASRRAFGKRLESILHHIRDMDGRLVGFYRDTPGRFAAAGALALANWSLGVVEIHVALMFLGYPISWAEAWIVEAVAQMVRAGTFFIPLSIGAQEGAFFLVCGAITGVPSAGVSLAVVRRLREVVWIGAGFGLGAALSLRPGRA